MISEIDLKMLDLLKDVLHNKLPNKISSIDFNKILKEMNVHTISFLISDYVYSLGLSEKDINEYIINTYINRKKYHILMKEEERILTSFMDNDIPVVVIKGASACLYYDHPENRVMGDIDLLVLESDYNRAFKLLNDIGLKTYKIADRHNVLFTDKNVEVELHKHFSSGDNKYQNDILDKIIFSGIKKREYKTVSNYKVVCLPETVNGLVLLGHINQHLASGLGLRQIIDWMKYVEHCFNEDSFIEFLNLANKIGMKDLAIVVTFMCKKYLDLNIDYNFSNNIEETADELMEYILDCGNFSRKKDPAKTQTTLVLTKFYSPFKAINLAHRYGLINSKLIKKHKWLKPFASIYQIVHWIKVGIRKGVDISIFINAIVIAKKQAHLFKKLGVTRL